MASETIPIVIMILYLVLKLPLTVFFLFIVRLSYQPIFTIFDIQIDSVLLVNNCETLLVYTLVPCRLMRV